MNESMNYEINRLLNFALQQGLIRESDVFYSANLLLVQRLRWLLLAEFCLGLSKGITISVGVTILMRFLVYWVQDNVKFLSSTVAFVSLDITLRAFAVLLPTSILFEWKGIMSGILSNTAFRSSSRTASFSKAYSLRS